MSVGVFIAISGAFVHAVSFIFRKRGLENTDFRLFVLARLIVGIIVAPLALWTIGNGLSGLTMDSILPFVYAGSIGGGFLCLFSTTLAIHELGASKTHALTSANPLVTAFLEVVMLGAVLTLRVLRGTVFIVIGAVTLSAMVYADEDSEEKSEPSRPLLGLGLAIFTVLAIGLHMVLAKMGLNLGATPLQGLFIQSVTATILFALYVLIWRPKLRYSTLYKSSDYWIAGTAMIGVPLLSLYAMATLSATVASSLMRTAPLFTFVLTFFLLRGIEKARWQTGLSTMLIVGGAVLVSVQ